MKAIPLTALTVALAASAGAGVAYWTLAPTSRVAATETAMVVEPAAEKSRSVPVPCPIWVFNQIANLAAPDAE